MVFTEPWWSKLKEPGYPQFQADEIEKAHRKGAKGLKVLKVLGLFLRENIASGPLVKIDDKRYDPMWEAAGGHKMPVLIHVSDPEAFFLPIDKYNERYEELQAHPDWSFHGDFPSNRELHEARNRVLARHPKTQFVLAHVGDSENLAWVGEWLDSFPNMHVEFGARIGELGDSREPPASSSRSTRTGSCSGRMLFRVGTTTRSRSTATRSIRSTTGSCKPKTSISTILRPGSRRKGVGGFTGWACRMGSCERCTTKTRRGCWDCE